MNIKASILDYINAHQDFYMETFMQLYRDDIVLSIQNKLIDRAGEGLEGLGTGLNEEDTIDQELDISLFFEQWSIAFEPSVRVNGKDVHFDIFISMNYSFKVKGIKDKFVDEDQKYILMANVFDGQTSYDNLVDEIKVCKERLEFYKWNNNDFDLLMIIKGEEKFPVIYGEISLMLMRSDNSSYFRKSKELMPG